MVKIKAVPMDSVNTNIISFKETKIFGLKLFTLFE